MKHKNLSKSGIILVKIYLFLTIISTVLYFSFKGSFIGLLSISLFPQMPYSSISTNLAEFINSFKVISYIIFLMVNTALAYLIGFLIDKIIKDEWI